jgi:hypothetical protein
LQRFGGLKRPVPLNRKFLLPGRGEVLHGCSGFAHRAGQGVKRRRKAAHPVPAYRLDGLQHSERTAYFAFQFLEACDCFSRCDLKARQRGPLQALHDPQNFCADHAIAFNQPFRGRRGQVLRLLQALEGIGQIIDPLCR